MRLMPCWLLLLSTAVGVAACSPARAPSAGGPGPGEPGGTVAAPPSKSLTIAVAGEPTHFIFDFGSTGFGSVGNADLGPAVHQGLTTYDDRGVVHPVLAAELPSREKGTWIVRVDGTMQTTYRLRPKVSWHDGTPLVAQSFVFGWTVTKDPELPISASGSVAKLLQGINTPDDGTLVLEWATTYPFAHAIARSGLAALPVHLLEGPYQTDKERFPDLPYWKREFVGLGPYQLAGWEPGSHLVLKAYDRHYAGRPKVDTVVVRFLPHQPTIVANLLAGAVDGVINRALDFEQAMFVKEEWERAGRKPLVVAQPTHWRMVAVQFRDPRPREMLDPRVRRALLHAIDRQAVVDALMGGQSPVSHTFVPPDDARWEWVQDVVAKYDYDARRTGELLGEVGWRRGADGIFANAAGERVVISYETSPALERTTSTVAPYLKAAGLEVDQVVLSLGDARDARRVVQFPALQTSNIPLSFEQNLERIYGPRCPSEANRWTGFNSGCYRNPQHDQVIDGLRKEIDSSEQRRLWRELVAIQTQELPVLPMFFLIVVTIFREGVTGVKGDTNPRSGITWNIAEWDVS